MSQSPEPVSPSAEQVPAALACAERRETHEEHTLISSLRQWLPGIVKSENDDMIVSRILAAEVRRLSAQLAEKETELYGIRACGEKARRKIELPDSRPDNSDAAVWERACAYWSSNALSIQAQLASQQEALSAAADALTFYADESHWDNEVTAGRGEDEFHAILNDRTMFVADRSIIDYADGWDVAKAALARVNACLPVGIKHATGSF